jgi:hypothetical protein
VPALAEAQVGIAMGTGADVAMETAGVTLVKGDLGGVVRAIRLGRAMTRNIRQNLFFAFAYNAIGVPLAAGLLYPALGIVLSPISASAAMSLTSVSVVVNSLRLQRRNVPESGSAHRSAGGWRARAPGRRGGPGSRGRRAQGASARTAGPAATTNFQRSAVAKRSGRMAWCVQGYWTFWPSDSLYYSQLMAGGQSAQS